MPFYQIRSRLWGVIIEFVEVTPFFKSYYLGTTNLEQFLGNIIKIIIVGSSHVYLMSVGEPMIKYNRPFKINDGTGPQLLYNTEEFL